MTTTAQEVTEDRFVDLPAGPRICYRVDGPDDGTPLLLIAGLGLDVTSWPQRTAELAGITAPTLVVHGDRDLMVHPTGGRATAAAIPGARHVELPGTAHHLAPGVVDRLVELTTDLARSAGADLTQSTAGDPR